jgi:hypothetical protein
MREAQQVPSTGDIPICPGCGYLRTGLDASALCPECGAEGIDHCVQLHGVARSLRAAQLVGFGVASSIAVSTLLNLFRPDAVTVLLVSGSLAVFLGYRLFRGRDGGDQDQILWTVHSKGIIVRNRGTQTLVPRESIKRLDCAESFLGPVTQVMIIRRMGTLSGALGRTHVLYLRGEPSVRRDLCERARALLGLT